MNTPWWCKMASNLDSHPKIRRAGRNGREVFLFALRRNSEPGNQSPGVVPKQDLDPWFIADQLMMSEDEARHGLERACHAGLLIPVDSGFQVSGWDEHWASRPKTDAERSADYRSRKPSRTVTDRHGPSREQRDAALRVTANHASHVIEENRIEESRGEENLGLGAVAPNKSDSPGLAEVKAKVDSAKRSRSKPSSLLPEDWSPRAEERGKAVESGLRCDGEAEAFRDHHAAKGSRFTDWDAAFRTWLRNAVKFSRGKPGDPRVGRVEPQGPESFTDGEVLL